jgi:hypothetical protein
MPTPQVHPQRIRQRIVLNPRDVVAVTRLVYAATRELRVLLSETVPPAEWEFLDAAIKNELEADVRLIARGSIREPEQLHRRWLDAAAKNGWRYGPVKSVPKKRHPHVVEFKELPPLQQLKYVLVWGIAGAGIQHYAAQRLLLAERS